MASWSVTTSSSIVISGRIDGEYYLPAYLANEALLSKLETKPLPNLFSVSDGNHLSVSRHFKEGVGIPYYRGQDINDFFIENASPVRISESIFSSGLMRRSHFCPGDVLLSIVGTIGSLSIVPSSLGDATGSCKIAILRPKKGECSSEFLAAFLLSRYGQLQIHRNTRGAVQMGLILKDLARIRIPDIPEHAQLEISKLIDGSLAANSTSRASFAKAKQLLNSELGLDKPTVRKQVGYVAQASTVADSKRADAEYYNPSAREIVQRITALQHTTVRESFNVQGGFPWKSAKFLPDNSGAPVVRIRNIRPDYIVPSELTSIDVAYANSVGVLKAHRGDVVVGMDGIKYFYASVLEGDCFVNQRVCHLSPRSSSTMSSEYAVFMINSIIGQAQLMRDMTVATTVGHLTNRDVAKLVIPTISRSFHDEITALIRKSIDSKEDSKCLLEQAKARVEQLIEEAVQP